MRIIAGRFKGREIKAVPGTGTRPTTDRTREAWASTINSLCSEGFEGLTVLDAFAGSGALGLEALSRGAAAAVFAENDKRALAILRQNVSQFREDDSLATILGIDVLSPRAVKPLRESGPYDLVFLDPPYCLPAVKVEGLLRLLAKAGSLAMGALIAYEHSSVVKSGLDGLVLCSACSPAGLSMVSCKTYGITGIEYLRYH